MKRRLLPVATALLAVIAIASIVSRPRRSALASARLLNGAQIDAAVLGAIRRSCLDCHSEATRYPWYSYIAPVSLLIANDVKRGREHLNLSRWSEYSLIRRERALSEIANQVKDRGMPLPLYTLLHRDAKLSDADIDAVFQWTQTERNRLIMENLAAPRSSPRDRP